MKPRLTEEDEQSKDLQRLQVLQNDMIRLINGKRRSQHTNMKELRAEMKMMSVNQMTVYHVLLETFNIKNHGSVESIRQKLTAPEAGPDERQTRSRTRGDLIPQTKPNGKCMRLSYIAPLIWNKLPEHIQKSKTSNQFKFLIKKWIWDGNIPS